MVRRAGLAWRSVLAVGVVLLLGAAGTLLAAVTLHNSAHRSAVRALDQKQLAVSRAIDAEIARYQAALTHVAAAVGAQAELEAAEFTAITAPLDQHWLPGAVEVSYIVPVPDARVAAVQAFWRAQGAGGLTLRRTGPAGAEHYFPVLGRDLDGTKPSVGLDALSSASVVEALRTARAGRTPAVSRTDRLLHDADLPPVQQTPAFVLAVPVIATSPPAEAGRFRGWAVMSFRAGDFLQGTIGQVAGDQVGVDLVDGPAAAAEPVATWLAKKPLDATLPARAAAVNAPERTWTLTVRATTGLLPASETGQAGNALLIGSIMTVLLAGLATTIVTSRNRALRQVAHATAALRADIERREEVERQLRKREEELVLFAGVVAHDLRSPLAGLVGYADMLLAEAAHCLDDEHKMFLERMQGSASRMQNLLDDLLTYATAENAALHVTWVDLSTMMHEIRLERRAAAHDRPPRIEFENLPLVAADASMLREALDNLIGNAIRNTPAQQTPDIDVTCVEVPDGGWRIEVADRGEDLPAESDGDIFDAFVQVPGKRKGAGRGLGLAIVHRIVERHGGTLGVEPHPGGGSRFWFTLPDAPTAAEHTPLVYSV